MTYKQLLEALSVLTEEQLQKPAALYDFYREEYHPMEYCGLTEGDKVVDDEHPIIIFNDCPVLSARVFGDATPDKATQLIATHAK